MGKAPFFQDLTLCSKKFLVISNDKSFKSAIEDFLKRKNYDYLIVSFCSLKRIESLSPDFIFIDVDVVDKEDLCFSDKLNLLLEFSSIPIVFVYSSLEEADILLSFELGVIDCITKISSFDFIFSKILVFFKWMEKMRRKENQIVSFGPFVVDFSSLTIRKNNKYFSLTLSEFKILQKLIQEEGKIVSRKDLLKEIDPIQESLLERNVDVHVAALRKKLGPNFHWLITVRGVGYRFDSN